MNELPVEALGSVIRRVVRDELASMSPMLIVARDNDSRFWTREQYNQFMDEYDKGIVYGIHQEARRS